MNKNREAHRRPNQSPHAGIRVQQVSRCAYARASRRDDRPRLVAADVEAGVDVLQPQAVRQQRLPRAVSPQPAPPACGSFAMGGTGCGDSTAGMLSPYGPPPPAAVAVIIPRMVKLS
jgi:hypothetical protein